MRAGRGVLEDVGAGFARDETGARWTYAGALTNANAAAVLAATVALAMPTTGEIDLADIDAIDSTAVAVLIALKRRAAGEGRALTFINVPAALTALADLYGVEEILVA